MPRPKYNRTEPAKGRQNKGRSGPPGKVRPIDPETGKKKEGRPEVQVDTVILENLAAVGCTMFEMAHHLGVSHQTLERRDLKEAIERGRQNRNLQIRRKQYMIAMDGNIGMLIWLGKQYLGQSDKMETDMNLGMGSGNAPAIEITLVPANPTQTALPSAAPVTIEGEK